MKAGRSIRDQHLDSAGKERMKFSSHWRAGQYIEKRGLVGMESFYCERCRTVHIDYPLKVFSNAMKLPGF